MTSEKLNMVTQGEVISLNKFFQGEFEVIINRDKNSKGEVFFLSFKRSNKTPEVLFSKNGLRREFKSLDTIRNYVIKHCSNAQKVTIQLEEFTSMPYLKAIEVKATKNQQRN